MKVIGFNASPRKEGNTAWAINKILESVKERGAETELLHFSDLEIKPCVSCYACKQGEGGCAVNDDMRKLYGALEQADALILGSPVYMGQMSAQAKIFTDRLFALFSPRFSPYFKEKKKIKLILLFTQGNPDSGLFRPYFDYTEKMFQMLELDVKGVHVVAGMRDKPAREREDLPAVMKDIASSLF